MDKMFLIISVNVVEPTAQTHVAQSDATGIAILMPLL
jgi:hypothetical protein